jgi:hypothetical protein
MAISNSIRVNPDLREIAVVVREGRIRPSLLLEGLVRCGGEIEVIMLISPAGRN